MIEPSGIAPAVAAPARTSAASEGSRGVRLPFQHGRDAAWPRAGS